MTHDLDSTAPDALTDWLPPPPAPDCGDLASSQQGISSESGPETLRDRLLLSDTSLHQSTGSGISDQEGRSLDASAAPRDRCESALQYDACASDSRPQHQLGRGRMI